MTVGGGMSELRVRDHSQLCKHGFMFGHTVKKGEIVQVGQLPAVCPGGKEIVLREAFRWDTQDSLTVDWEPGFNGKPFYVEVVG